MRFHLAPGQIKPKAKRTPRPGQAPPTATAPRNRNKRQRVVGERGQTSSGIQRTDDGDQSAYAQRMATEANNFNIRRETNGEEYYIHFEGSQSLTMKCHKSTAADLQTEVNEVIEKGKRDHPCCADANPQDFLTLERTRSVLVVCFDHRFSLNVPNFNCRLCKKVVTVHPYAVDCAPTSPTEYCVTWVHRSVVHHFRDGHKNNGHSANGKLVFMSSTTADWMLLLFYCCLIILLRFSCSIRSYTG